MKKKHMEILDSYEIPSENIKDSEINLSHPMSFAEIREILIQISTILEEREDENIYVVSLNSGKFNSNNALLLIELDGTKLYISGYAKEGIINQKTYEKAVIKLKSKLSGKTEKIFFKKTKSKIITIVIILIIAVSFVLGINIVSTISAIEGYNKAAQNFNTYVDEYNEIAAKTNVENVEGLASSLQELKIEKENAFEALKVIFGNNSKNKIKSDTKTIYELITHIENSVHVIKQITSPTEQFVIDRLKNVDTIQEIQSVTEKNNPDGLLNKKGGYSSCIYFSSKDISQENFTGKDIVSKGTDCGGAIEIYNTKEDAEARCEYLSGFDGTILYSGSYAIVGTMVIRTSYLLSNDKQLELTNKITQELTKIKAN